MWKRLLEQQLESANLLETGISPVKLEKREAEIVILEEGPGNRVRKCWYGPESIRSGVNIFEGAQVYANHPRKSEQEDLPERDVKDIIGRIKNCWIQESNGKLQLRGILKIFEGEDFDWAVALIKESIQAKKEGFRPVAQMSIHADGDIEKRIIEGDEYNYVTRIKSAVSVDVVTKGGIQNAGFVKFMENALGGQYMDRQARFRQIQQKLAESLTQEEAQFLEAYLQEQGQEDEQAAVQEPGQLPEMFEDENGNLFAATGQTDEAGNPIVVDEEGNAHVVGGVEEPEQEPDRFAEEDEDGEEIEEPNFQGRQAPIGDPDEEVSVSELAHQFPDLAREIDEEERGMEESERDVDLVQLKMENKLLKSRMIADSKLRESGLPDGYISIDELVGRSPETMDRVIEANRRRLMVHAQMLESAVGSVVEPTVTRGQMASQVGQRILRGSLMPR